MINYNNGKIYKIIPINGEDNNIYIGSTTKTLLCQRFAVHKCIYNKYKKGETKQKLTSFLLFDKYGCENCKIVLIELVNAASKDELLRREAFYIKSLNCVNKQIPLRNNKEYYIDNKEIISKKHQKYYDDNKDTILDYHKSYYEENKEKVLETNKKWKENNKEYHDFIVKDWIKNNKERYETNRKQTIECNCGICYTKSNEARYCKSKKHQNFINTINL